VNKLTHITETSCNNYNLYNYLYIFQKFEIIVLLKTPASFVSL